MKDSQIRQCNSTVHVAESFWYFVQQRSVRCQSLKLSKNLGAQKTLYLQCSKQKKCEQQNFLVTVCYNVTYKLQLKLNKKALISEEHQSSQMSHDQLNLAYLRVCPPYQYISSVYSRIYIHVIGSESQLHMIQSCSCGIPTNFFPVKIKTKL